LLLGVASLTRPHGLIFTAIAALALALRGHRRPTERLATGAILILTVVLALAPWTIRNRVRLGAWVPVSTHGGITFYQSNCAAVLEVPAYYGNVAPRAELPGLGGPPKGQELARDRVAWGLGIAFLNANRHRVPELLARKSLRFWRFRSGVRGTWWWDNSRILGRLAKRLDCGLVYFSLVIPLFILGLVTTARRYRELTLLYAVVAAHLLVSLVFHGSLRARVPVEPVIVIFASAALLNIAGRGSLLMRRARNHREPC
jgi:hypothetical protein